MNTVNASGNFIIGFAAAMMLASCGGKDAESDAFGNFEANEVIISAQTAGRLLSFDAAEGRRLSAGAIVGVVDTTQLVLQRNALQAQRGAAQSRIAGVEAQAAVFEEQQRIAFRERERVRGLVELDAASRKQADEVNDQITVLERQIASVLTQRRTIAHELGAIDAQVAQINDQISRSIIENPVDGVVLASYAEPFELAAPGKPLYKIGELDTLILRAYVSSGQLSEVRIGSGVTVIFDGGDGELKSVPGEVTWIASEAEFTPRLIQTREERVNLVYAIQVRVPNESGTLKIGMPGEVRFRP